MSPETTEEKPVQLVSVTVQVPKELNDVRLALVSLLSDLKAKKDMTSIIGGNLKLLSDAIDNINQLDDEFRGKLKESLTGCGLTVGEVMGALLD